MSMLRTIERRRDRARRPYEGSEGKRAKKTERTARKMLAYARWVTGTLLLAVGRAAETVFVPKTQDAYHEDIFTRGTTITAPGRRPFGLRIAGARS